ncbi:MFS transporter [Companilactobacillus mindensis]|nr:MFS transporter [Companilactobacillus mindensis]
MAVVTGVIVANLNFIQPIENLIANDFGISKSVVGMLAMITQLGYAFGLLLIVPLGDIFDRYHLIQFMMILSIGSLLLAFWAPNAGVFAIATALIGITSVAPQIIIPFAGYLAPVLQRGKVLGIVLSGLLTGILLSRSFSGLLGSIMPWQDIYLIAAGIDLIFLIIGIILLDLGTQFSQVSNQAIVQSLNRQQSSRNNSVFMFSYFLGGSFGTLFATWAWSKAGWLGVCGIALVFLIIALANHFIIGEPKKLNTETD